MTRLYITALFIALLIATPGFTMGNAFKIGFQEGDWATISDFLVESFPSTGEARLQLYADDYRLGSWTISFDINIDVEPGKEAEAWIKLMIPEIELEVYYYEWYRNGGIEPEEIRNVLSVEIGGEEVYRVEDSAVEPFDSRLNMRMYMAVANIQGEVVFQLRDEYGDYGGGNKIFYQDTIPYNNEPVTFVIEIYKYSEAEASIEIPFIINTPRDSLVFERLEIQTIDYSVNAVFSISLIFLVGAITFNLLSARIRELETAPPEEEREKKGKRGKGRKGK